MPNRFGLLVASVLAVVVGACTPEPVTDAGPEPTPECVVGTDGCACDAGACADGLVCNADVCVVEGCPVGRVGCPCDDGACVDDNAACNADGLCENVNCPTGDEGCNCGAGDACNRTSSGQPLVCNARDICASARCVPGDTGCACLLGATCTDGAATCDDGLCVDDSCTAGTRDCECAGGACNGDLRCFEGRVCIDAVGSLGGACFSNGSCLLGNRCSNNTCVPCSVGQQGCACDVADGCVEGLECSAGQCTATTGFARQAITAPQCWTPCQGDGLLVDGVMRACPADGLMAGCLPGLSCLDGSCVPPEGDARSCDVHTACPEFQACLGGRCASNCETNNDCLSSADCDKKVCRKRCTIVEENCPEGSFCSTDDGEAGHCVETVDPSAPGEGELSEIFLSQDAIVMSSAQTTGAFSITNGAPVAKRITLTKRLERATVNNLVETTRLGPTQTIRKNPAACTPGSLGCRCSNADTKCLSTSLGLPMTCSAANICTLPTCVEGSAGCICTDGVCGKVCDGPDCPLSWLTIKASINGAPVASSSNVSVSFELPAGEEARIRFDGAGDSSLSYWDGEVAIDDGTSDKGLQVSYAQLPEGAWTGEMFTFGDFSVDEAGLATWMARKDQDARVTDDEIENIHNAFLQVWANFRRGGGPDFAEFAAVLTSTRTESWRSPSVVARCTQADACFPFSNPSGVATYTTDIALSPVPSGVITLPFGMNLRADNDTEFSGRVRTSAALHYGGDPEVSLSFANAPSSCSNADDPNAPGCLVFITAFNAETSLGGRYRTTGQCTARYQSTQVPWLVPGFVGGTTLDPLTGRLVVNECRDTLTPFADSDTSVAANISLAGGNPLLDGRERTRRLELVDGALINSDAMLVIYKETIPALVGASPANDLVAYGYMFLSRESTVPSDDEYVGNPPTAVLAPPPPLPAIACSAEINAALPRNASWDAKVDLLMGAPAVSSGNVIFSSTTTESTTEQAHYLCVDTRTFDTDTECPYGSPVKYFTVKASQLNRATVLNDPCQNTGTCDQALARYRREGKLEQEVAAWRCEDNNKVYCSDDRFDLLQGKRFFGKGAAPPVFADIRNDIDEAFRYRTRFQDRSGKGIGFAPSICSPVADEIPYCYDPIAIEKLADRMSCLLALQADPTASTGSANKKTELNTFLRESFAYSEIFDAAANVSAYHSGYEKLTAELQIMLGDDALTKALSSRFDLAGLQVASFPGAQLEPDGITLSGVAGAEMRLLYQATQHYSIVLDRFFGLLPSVNRLIANSDTVSIIDQATIETYFDRVIRASTQKARVWNEISKRYQNLGRSDLAKLVIERAYTAGTIESTVLTQLMIDVAGRAQVDVLDGIVASIRRAQVSYGAALSDMRAQHLTISDAVDYFGFPPDHIPFPAIESEASRDNGFEVALNRAQQRLELARQAEEAALTTTRSFDTDAASFQNELTRVENTYEAQLADLCGTFSARGRVYPAIRKYAALDQRAQLFGDPCGRMGTGQIHESVGGIDLALIEMQRARQVAANAEAEIAIEEERIDAVCATTNMFREATVKIKNQQSTMQARISDYQLGLATADRALAAVSTYANLTKCTIGTSTDCVSAGFAATIFTAGLIANEAAQFLGASKIQNLEGEVRDLQTAEAQIGFAQQCRGADIDFVGQSQTSLGIAEIESKATIARLSLRMSELQLDLLREQYDMQQALARVEQLRNQARRLEAEMDEVTQQTINIEAARNDPNVRIYKNDAVQTADTTFYSALREAFLATRVFEYHTSQTYADFGTLLLARMVSRGDFNLQSYLVGLEDAYRAFEDVQGVADIRVAVLSMRDDILVIPRISLTGEPLSSAQRIALLRESLADPALLDDHGYISLSFNTGPANTSPLTRNHKIRHVEAEIVTTGSVDPLARVYLRAVGTSAVQGLDDEIDFYTLPKRTAVINAFFSGDKVYDPAVYKSFRFSDRPLFNSRWDLIINTVDEPANDDLRTEDLTDIRIYIYYSDFTVY